MVETGSCAVQHTLGVQKSDVMVECVGRLVCMCFFFQAEDGIRDVAVTGVQTCALPIYATEMLRAGVSFPAVMKLLGHLSPEMTMQYLDVVLTDLQREFELARSKPRHLVPQPKAPSAPLRSGLNGVLDSLRTAQHVLEMFRRTLPNGVSRRRLDRLSNRLSKILREARKLASP